MVNVICTQYLRMLNLSTRSQSHSNWSWKRRGQSKATGAWILLQGDPHREQQGGPFENGNNSYKIKQAVGKSRKVHIFAAIQLLLLLLGGARFLRYMVLQWTVDNLNRLIFQSDYRIVMRVKPCRYMRVQTAGGGIFWLFTNRGKTTIGNYDGPISFLSVPRKTFYTMQQLRPESNTYLKCNQISTTHDHHRQQYHSLRELLMLSIEPFLHTRQGIQVIVTASHPPPVRPARTVQSGQDERTSPHDESDISSSSIAVT